ncbi:30S ribosomal protein S13 [candidate division MSBL1 archaeon SCGC-AAA382C18]|uniref:Small ribosomal subunit protein uS13 n=1 Tax=candidate division MSBL1 archaeon SCGC-AAA382C18 TaxID=1698281 RepID=A0A133VKQ8_9EURY|nr:30S ribosomal protein S13 [candidate division MSBL1 archaeon SCGC-AAA382C18]
MSEEAEEEEIKGIVRVAGRDLKGERSIQAALSGLKGVGPSMSKAILTAAEIKGDRKVGSLSDEQVKGLEKILEDPADHGVPKWMLNRRKDYETGEDKHLIGGDIEMTEREDISREKDMRSRRGIRHQRGLPVRGQRTRSTGRKGMTVGVEREKLKEKSEEEEEE